MGGESMKQVEALTGGRNKKKIFISVNKSK